MPATVQLPPDFDAAKKYPVWLQIYGGPHFPQVSDTFKKGKGVGRPGYVMFRMDPRSASSTLGSTNPPARFGSGCAIPT